MKAFAELIGVLIMLVSWLVGIVTAHGAWSTLFAVLISPYAWYLVAERALQLSGWVAA